jgi:hypothetical protein
VSGFPVGDWQFWVVSLLVGGAVALVLGRRIRTARRRRRGVPVAVRTPLTIGGSPVGRPRDGDAAIP